MDIDTDAHDIRRWTGRTRGGIIGNWIFVTLIRYAGPVAAYCLLMPVSFYFLFFAPEAMSASQDYLRRLGYGGRSWWWRMGMSWGHFYAFGQALVDRIAVFAGAGSRFSFERIGYEHIEAALKENKGLVILGAHCGNLEIAGQQLSSYGKKVNVVAFEGEAAHIRRIFGKVNQQRGFSVIEVDGSSDASFEIIAALSRGEVVAMRGDRGLGVRKVAVPFLGAPALFPAGPYYVAAASGAPVIYGFAMRQKRYRYVFTAYPAEHFAFGRREERDACLQAWAGGFVRRLEEQLKRFPLQWYNFYDFWGDVATMETTDR
jgi:predicted LPLAT superfamily acyltransferase